MFDGLARKTRREGLTAGDERVLATRDRGDLGVHVGFGHGTKYSHRV
jgi:hypothetical protein